MKIFTLQTSPLETNTYIVINDDRAFVVDAGGDAQKIFALIEKEKAKLEAILLTHAHFDHIGGVAELQRLANNKYNANDEKGNGVKILIHKDDVDKISSYKNLAFSMGCTVEKFVPDIALVGGEELYICGLKIKVLHTAGHSKGGVCYIVGDNIFVGDTIFKMSYGRTDFYDGNFQELKNNIINKLFRLNGDYVLYTGHGDKTTLAFERENNIIKF